jgi:hypothetical protein
MAKRGVTIRFIDDSTVSFDFPQQVADPQAVVRRMEKLLDSPYVLVEAEGALLMYPVTNIKSIQVFPAPEKLPDTVIRGASLTG